jgi:replicative DNA helicase
MNEFLRPESPNVSPLFGLSQRQPPANLAAEQAVLGALLANNRAYERVGEFLRPEHFADDIHGTIYRAIQDRINAGRLADAVTLRQDFEHNGQLEEVGGPAYLAQLLTAMVGIINAGEYGKVIKEAWRRRRLIETGEVLVNRAFGGEEPGESKAEGGALLLAQNAAGELLDLAMDDTAEGPVSIGEAALTAVSEAQLAASGSGPRGLPFGIPKLDHLLGRARPEKLYIFAGRPGMGKSVLGMVMAHSLAACREPEAPAGEVLVFSLEMSSEELGQRMLAALTQIHGDKIRDGKMTQPEWDALVAAQQKLGKLRLTVDSRAGLTIEQIAVRARAVLARQKLRAVVLDHLQIVAHSPHVARAGATASLTHITQNLKRLAKSLKVPVIALCQLNRGVEGRDDKRPTLADLRQSGSIEEDADVVGFVFREDYYLSKAEPQRKPDETQDAFDSRHAQWRAAMDRAQGRLELIVAKHRGGPTGTIPLRFDGPTSRIWQENNDE